MSYATKNKIKDVNYLDTENKHASKEEIRRGIVERLDKAMDEFGWSQRQMSVACDRSESIISHWKKPEKDGKCVIPPLDALVRLCENTGLSLDWIVFGVGDMFA